MASLPDIKVSVEKAIIDTLASVGRVAADKHGVRVLHAELTWRNVSTTIGEQPRWEVVDVTVKLASEVVKS